MRGFALLTSLTLTGCVWTSVADEPGTLRPGDTGTPFDYDWSVEMHEGGLVEIAALSGRPLVVNVWATWCPPCVAELASFERLSEMLVEAEVEATLLFVSPESSDVVGPFVTRFGWDLPFAVERRRMPASLGELVLPTTFVVAPDGEIALRHRGATAWDRPEVVDLIRGLASGGGR